MLQSSSSDRSFRKDAEHGSARNLPQHDVPCPAGSSPGGQGFVRGRQLALTSLRSHGWSWVSRAQSVSGVTRAYLKRFWMAEDVQMYLYKNSFPVCSEMALADMAT